MSDLVRVPQCGLIPAERAMTADELKRRLEELGNADPEVGHGLLDDLMVRALEAIRDGHPDPQGLARAVLVAESADFPRYYA